MVTSDRFSRVDVLRILTIPEKQLAQWEKMELVAWLQPGKEQYDFRDLIALRTTKQLLENGVSVDRLRRALQALQKQLSETRTPLQDLRIVSNGKEVLVESAGKQLEPISGQFILNFKTGEICNKVVAMPERNADSLFALALEYDSNPETRTKAAELYDRVIALDPGNANALLNRGTISFENGDLESAADYFERAVAAEPESPVAQYNLGSILDDLGMVAEARQHLRLATRLDAKYADAHYNLAIVCDKMNAQSEARDHWITYLKLVPSGDQSRYARSRLE
jgi:tetratricopeptide (TPR) repeat protein